MCLHGVSLHIMPIFLPTGHDFPAGIQYGVRLGFPPLSNSLQKREQRDLFEEKKMGTTFFAPMGGKAYLSLFKGGC